MSSDEDDIFVTAKAVNSRGDFIDFVNLLNEDLVTNNEDWENKNLKSFLAGLSGFTRDMEGFYRNMGEVVDIDVISWRMMAQMLLAAKVYGN